MSHTPHPDQTHARRWPALFWSSWLASALICGALLFTPGYESDIVHYKYWTRQLAVNGIETAYSGKNIRDYVIYPPVFVYVYALVGRSYAQWVDPRFDVERMKVSVALTAGIKGAAVAAHLALGGALFFLIRRLHSDKWATIASSAYLLNPAVIFDSAYWGAPDGLHSLGLVSAYGLSELRTWLPAWVSLALAAASKPQAWILMPLFGWRQLVKRGPIRTLQGIAIIGLVWAALILPFVLDHRLPELLTLPAAIANYMPFVSVNAHNLWWLVADGQLLLDGEPWIGPFSYRQVSTGLVLMLTIAILWQARSARTGRLLTLAAYQAFGWYCLATHLHENHAFMIIPLLALALPFDRWLWTPLIGVTVTLLANMALYDPALSASLSTQLVYRLSALNSVGNLALLALWTWRLFGMPSRSTEDKDVPARRVGSREWIRRKIEPAGVSIES
ncbi:MAG TPA: hypothetical protein VHX16_15550 [Chloroflexota bacterium]|nr:hypothetical protein [Chloroflexota bacterium]